MHRQTSSDRTRFIIITVALAAAASAAAVSQAMFMMPTDAPVDRLVKNAEAYIKENPEDAGGYYILGRIHYLAWSSKTGLVPVWRLHPEDSAEKPEVVPDAHAGGARHRQLADEAQRRALAELEVASVRDLTRDQYGAFGERVRGIQQQLRKDDWTPTSLEPQVLRVHADKAIANFRKAIEMEPANGLYHLVLASILEQYAPDAPKADEEADDNAAESLAMRTQSLASYQKAFELTRAEDAKQTTRPIEGLTALVSYNAAQGYQRVAGQLGDAHAPNAALSQQMTTHLAKMNDLPMGAITPIVFTFVEHESLTDLLNADASVMFDLDGTGRPQRYQWVRPTTGILVWDPADRRQITSGTQLFGSVTWWLLPGDGYRAMDLLDDNRDGELAGDELRGLAVWFDRNGDGVSTRDEVMPLADLPIAGLSVRAESRDGNALMHRFGLRLTDGRRLPTYDWIATPTD